MLTFIIHSEAASQEDTVLNTLTANADPRLVLMAERLEANVFIQNTSDLASNVFIQNSSDLASILAEQLKANVFIQNTSGLASNAFIQNSSNLVSILGEHDNGNDHIRGQNWEGEEEGEEERELIVSHGGIMPTVLIATNQWTPPFVVMVGVLTIFAVVMIWRAANGHNKWAKDYYVPISDGSAKTSHMIYV